MELAGTVNLWVRGEDLFGKRCARARKPYDEHWSRIGNAAGERLCYQFGCVTRNDLIDELGMLVGVIGQTSANLPADW